MTAIADESEVVTALLLRAAVEVEARVNTRQAVVYVVIGDNEHAVRVLKSVKDSRLILDLVAAELLNIREEDIPYSVGQGVSYGVGKLKASVVYVVVVILVGDKDVVALIVTLALYLIVQVRYRVNAVRLSFELLLFDKLRRTRELALNAVYGVEVGLAVRKVHLVTLMADKLGLFKAVGILL